MYRGIFHFHSRFSFDSMLRIETIAHTLLDRNLNFLCLTDHNTIQGSLALRQYVMDNQLDIEVPLGAEYLTEYGDIIALFIKKEIQSRDFVSFKQEVKSQGGVLILPHPYIGHTHIEFLAKEVDFIEVYNARVSDGLNKKAESLAHMYNKKLIFSSDAHLSHNLVDVVLEFPKQGSFKQSFCNGDLTLVSYQKSRKLDIVLSQLIKSIKCRKFSLFVMCSIKFLYYLVFSNKQV